MKFFRNIIIVLALLILVLIDISFLSNFVIYGATILLSFAAITMMAFTNKSKELYLVLALMVLFFSIFSSLPVLIILINFLILPAVIQFVRTNYFPQPSAISSLPYFLISSFIFEAVILIYAKEFNSAGYLAVAYFVILNTATGVLCYNLYLKIYKMFRPEQIKI